jgi:hypothetical protein
MPARLSSGRNIYEELGSGFTLVALDAEVSIVRAFEEAAVRRGMPLKIIQDSRRDGREAYEASFILIRPDQFVAWTSNGEVADPAAVLALATGGADNTL